MQIEQLPVAELKAYERNSRTHDKKQIQAVADSIKEFGFTNPLLLRDDNTIIAGHGRLQAAKLLGLETVPCIRLAHLTPEQARAYVIADNALAEQAGWDKEILKLEIADLQAADYNLDLLGLDNLDKLLAGLPGTEGLTDADAIPDPPKEPKAQRGQVWGLGSHRLMCGDSTSLDDVTVLLGGGMPEMLFTDPPYGISIVSGSNVGGGGPIKFGKVGGEKIVAATDYVPFKNDDTTDTARAAIGVAEKIGIKNKIVWGGNYFTDFLSPQMCWIVWDKQNSGDFADVELAWTSYAKAARLYKWMWSGMSRQGDRKTEGGKRVHPTQKPVGLVVDILADFPAQTILDLFLGSGTTLIAAEKTGRICYGMELSEHYCDVIITRWENFTGKKAELLNP